MPNHEAPKSIKAERFFSLQEIASHLQNVEYILMATPSPEKFQESPIHFTIFLNTQEKFSQDIANAILEKFMDEHKMSHIQELVHGSMAVGFAQSTQETPMPMLLVRAQERTSTPYTLMYVYDFLAEAEGFLEVKLHNLTGWSYSYSS